MNNNNEENVIGTILQYFISLLIIYNSVIWTVLVNKF